MVALFFGCLEVTLDRGQEDDWFASTTIVVTSIVTVLSLAAFIPWELHHKAPIVPIRMFANRNFGLASVFLLLTGLIIFGTTLFIPQLLQQVMGYTATDAGLALTAGGLATIVAMPISGMLTGRIDARYLIGGSFLVQGLALLNMSHFNTNMSFADAAEARVFQAVGIPFLFVPLTNLAYVGLRPQDSNQGSAMMNMARNLGGTFGIALVETMLTRRQQFHQSHMVETLDPLNPNYVAGLGRITRAFIGHGQAAGAASSEALATLYRSVQRQSAMLSYVDVFQILAMVIFASLLLVFFMRGQAPAARVKDPP